MGTSRPLTALQRRNTIRLICDGVKRFKVGKLEDLSYSEAYEAILDDTNSQVGTEAITYTPDALRRITKLNLSYVNIAQNFLREQRKNQLGEKADKT